jgi:hypothetical protein
MRTLQKEMLNNIIVYSENSSFLIAQMTAKEFKQGEAVKLLETIIKNLKTFKKSL